MFMVCEPEAVGRAEASLLALALAAALERGGQVRLESEAGDGEQIVRSFGFREDHRLAWMRLEKLDPPRISRWG
jgi:hypothetical protein